MNRVDDDWVSELSAGAKQELNWCNGMKAISPSISLIIKEMEERAAQWNGINQFTAPRAPIARGKPSHSTNQPLFMKASWWLCGLRGAGCFGFLFEWWVMGAARPIAPLKGEDESRQSSPNNFLFLLIQLFFLFYYPLIALHLIFFKMKPKKEANWAMELNLKNLMKWSNGATSFFGGMNKKERDESKWAAVRFRCNPIHFMNCGVMLHLSSFILSIEFNERWIEFNGEWREQIQYIFFFRMNKSINVLIDLWMIKKIL